MISLGLNPFILLSCANNVAMSNKRTETMSKLQIIFLINRIIISLLKQL